MTDAEYVEKRDALIPRAETYANSKHGIIGPYGEEAHYRWGNEWSKSFHQKMNELAREAGLVG